MLHFGYNAVANLPWGYDMEMVQHGGSHWFLKAPDGRTYDTIRELFSCFRLRACICQEEADFEHMRRSLHAVDMDLLRLDRRFLVDDVFDGSLQFQRSTYQNLERQCFIRHDLDGNEDPMPDTALLTPEGRAVMMMLDETRPGSNIDTSPPALRVRYVAEMVRIHGNLNNAKFEMSRRKMLQEGA